MEVTSAIKFYLKVELFFSVLDRTPQILHDIAEKIRNQFTDVDIKTIKNDASEFYYMLEQDGFVVSGETFQECEEKDIAFSYKNLEHGILKKTFHRLLRRSKNLRNIF